MLACSRSNYEFISVNLSNDGIANRNCPEIATWGNRSRCALPRELAVVAYPLVCYAISLRPTIFSLSFRALPTFLELISLPPLYAGELANAIFIGIRSLSQRRQPSPLYRATCTQRCTDVPPPAISSINPTNDSPFNGQLLTIRVLYKYIAWNSRTELYLISISETWPQVCLST